MAYEKLGEVITDGPMLSLLPLPDGRDQTVCLNCFFLVIASLLPSSCRSLPFGFFFRFRWKGYALAVIYVRHVSHSNISPIVFTRYRFYRKMAHPEVWQLWVRVPISAASMLYICSASLDRYKSGVYIFFIEYGLVGCQVKSLEKSEKVRNYTVSRPKNTLYTERYRYVKLTVCSILLGFW